MLGNLGGKALVSNARPVQQQIRVEKVMFNFY